MEKLTVIFGKIVSGINLLAILTVAVFTVPGIFGLKPYIVLSGSMEPVIHTGAVAFINTRDRECEVGDIVTYQVSGPDKDFLVTHRVAGRKGENYVMKGDSNDTEDLAPVRPEQILGTYVFQIPKAGYFAGRWGDRIVPVIIFWMILLNGMVIGLEAANSGDRVFDKKQDRKGERDGKLLKYRRKGNEKEREKSNDDGGSLCLDRRHGVGGNHGVSDGQ